MELWGALPLLASGRRPGPVCEEGLTWGGSQALVIDMCFRGKIDTCLQLLEQRQKSLSVQTQVPIGQNLHFYKYNLEPNLCPCPGRSARATGAAGRHLASFR